MNSHTRSHTHPQPEHLTPSLSVLLKRGSAHSQSAAFWWFTAAVVNNIVSLQLLLGLAFTPHPLCNKPSKSEERKVSSSQRRHQTSRQKNNCCVFPAVQSRVPLCHCARALSLTSTSCAIVWHSLQTPHLSQGLQKFPHMCKLYGNGMFVIGVCCCVRWLFPQESQSKLCPLSKIQKWPLVTLSAAHIYHSHMQPLNYKSLTSVSNERNRSMWTFFQRFVQVWNPKMLLQQQVHGRVNVGEDGLY